MKISNFRAPFSKVEHYLSTSLPFLKHHFPVCQPNRDRPIVKSFLGKLHKAKKLGNTSHFIAYFLMMESLTIIDLCYKKTTLNKTY